MVYVVNEEGPKPCVFHEQSMVFKHRSNTAGNWSLTMHSYTDAASNAYTLTCYCVF